jgi:tetratricopeptide (TPR) repeat protein
MIAPLIATGLLALAQPAAEVSAPPVAPPTRTLAEDRLELCLDRARTDPTTAIVEADAWAKDASGSDTSYPQQCLGMAYTALLRWSAAEQAFLAAHQAAAQTDHNRRARLAAMAGNAALAEERAVAALVALNLAAGDAEATGDAGLRAIVEIDRSRALVMQGEMAQAEATLANARTLDPQSPYAWLLSATLARRLNKLDEAQRFIETAATLSPGYPETGLEAGVIAMLAGREDSARTSWQSVIDLAPESEAAGTARGYLAQLAGDAAKDPGTTP